VRAANEGHAVVEQFPREKVTEDFDALADRLLGSEGGSQVESSSPTKGTSFRLFGRAKEAARV
jgi:hypothetical protein